LKDSELLPENLEYVDLILQSAERAAKLSSNLLVFSRKQPMINQVFIIENHIKETLDILKNTISKDITLKLNILSGNTPIYGDAARIDSMILNICLNGVQAISNKGILSIYLDRKKLDSGFCSKSKFNLSVGEY